MYTFEEYLKLCDKRNLEYPAWRSGQTYFNTLVEIRPGISEKLRGTDIDCFYNDAKIAAFLTKVKELW